MSRPLDSLLSPEQRAEAHRHDVEDWVHHQSRQVRRADAAADLLFAVLIGILAAVAIWHWVSSCMDAPSSLLCAGIVGMPRNQRRLLPAGCDQQGRYRTRGMPTIEIEQWAPGWLERLARAYVRWCERRRWA